jgi:hypothetical protein
MAFRLEPLECPSRNRCHHLLKTFWNGATGWRDRQLPDGTVEWTSPSGRTYTTKPGGALFFPALATPTGEIVIAHQIGPTNTQRGLMMPNATAPAPKTAPVASPSNANTTPPATAADDSYSLSAPRQRTTTLLGSCDYFRSR